MFDKYIEYHPFVSFEKISTRLSKMAMRAAEFLCQIPEILTAKVVDGVVKIVGIVCQSTVVDRAHKRKNKQAKCKMVMRKRITYPNGIVEEIEMEFYFIDKKDMIAAAGELSLRAGGVQYQIE